MPEPPPTDGVVTLRPWGERDVPELLTIFRDPALSRWLPMIPYPYLERHARDWLASLGPRLVEGGGAHFAIVEAGTGAVVGGIGIRPEGSGRAEVGYWGRAERRGGGVAPRARR